MNEAQRQYCLEQMGIQTWFPRYSLPAAAPSVLQLQPIITGVKQAAESTVQESTKADAVIRQLDEVRADKPAATTELKNQTPSQPSPAGKSAVDADSRSVTPEQSKTDSTVQHTQSDMVRCRLALIVLQGNILVLNQLPAAGNGQLAVAHQHLLGRISHYLQGDPGDQQIKSIHPFRWPLLDLPDVDNSIAALRSALLAFIEGHAESAISGLLLMGSILSEQVFPPAGSDNLKRQALDKLSCRVATTYSLDQLIKMPELKRECWLALREFGKP